jgi:hypothetical protein
MNEISDEDIYFINRNWNRIKKALLDNFSNISKNELVLAISKILEVLNDDSISNKNEALKNLDINNEMEKLAEVAEYNQTPVNKQPEEVFYPRRPVVPPELKGVINREGVSRQDIKLEKSIEKSIEDARKLEVYRQKQSLKDKRRNLVNEAKTKQEELDSIPVEFMEGLMKSKLGRDKMEKADRNRMVENWLNEVKNKVQPERLVNNQTADDNPQSVDYIEGLMKSKLGRNMIEKADRNRKVENWLNEVKNKVQQEKLDSIPPEDKLARDEEGYVNNTPTEREQVKEQMSNVRDDLEKTPEVNKLADDSVAKLEKEDEGFVNEPSTDDESELNLLGRYFLTSDRLNGAKGIVAFSKEAQQKKDSEIEYYDDELKREKAEYVERYGREPTEERYNTLIKQKEINNQESSKKREGLRLNYNYWGVVDSIEYWQEKLTTSVNEMDTERENEALTNLEALEKDRKKLLEVLATEYKMKPSRDLLEKKPEPVATLEPAQDNEEIRNRLNNMKYTFEEIIKRKNYKNPTKEDLYMIQAGQESLVRQFKLFKNDFGYEPTEEEIMSGNVNSDRNMNKYTEGALELNDLYYDLLKSSNDAFLNQDEELGNKLFAESEVVKKQMFDKFGLLPNHELERPKQQKVSVRLAETNTVDTSTPYTIEEINQKIQSLGSKKLSKLYLANKSANKDFMKVMSDLSYSLPKKEYDYFKNHFTKQDIEKYMGPAILEYKNNLMVKENLTRAQADERTLPIFGVGLKKKNFEPIMIGRYLLDKNQLENQNLLHLTHTSGNNVKFFKKTYISDDMKDLIFSLLKNKKLNQSLYKSLETDEKDLLKRILDKCGLSSQLNLKLDSGKYSDVKKQYNDLKEQYLIICSEMEEGNDSPLLDKKYNKIVKELKQTILYMNKIGEMSKVQANHLIASL